jgi:phage terminase small subunit
MGLTPKKKRFAKEYIVDLNQTQAAIRAEYSPRSAYAQGCRLMKDAEVVEYIQVLMDKRSKRTEITADRVLEEIARIAFFNVKSLHDPNTGLLKNILELDDVQSAALAEVTETSAMDEERGAVVINKKYKLYDKVKSLEQLGKHLKLFSDKIEISGKLETLTDEELQLKLKALINGSSD